MLNRILSWLNKSFLGFIFIISASYAQNEFIENFNSAIDVNTDGIITITETIAYNPGLEVKRGIIRSLPVRYKGSFGTDYRVSFDVLSVKKDGEDSYYHLSSDGNYLHIKIGEYDKILSQKTHTYTITYKTRRQLGFSEEYTEFYWNIVGHTWQMPIKKASASITLPSGIPINPLDVSVLSGIFGFNNLEDNRIQINDNTILIDHTKPLKAGEGVTVSILMPAGYIQPPTQWQEAYDMLYDNRGSALLCVVFLLLSAYYLYFYLQKRKRRREQTIIPLFYPPKDMSPGKMHHFLTFMNDSMQIAVEIVAAAVAQAIDIEYEKRTFTHSYTLKEKNSNAPSLLPEQKQGLALLFKEKKLLVRLLSQIKKIFSDTHTIFTLHSHQFHHILIVKQS